LSTTALDEVGLWKFADCPNFADAHTGCNIDSSINVYWLHQPLNGLFKDHTWEWIVGFLKDIYGQENGFGPDRYTIFHNSSLLFHTPV
jgi:hypothetical protein